MLSSLSTVLEWAFGTAEEEQETPSVAIADELESKSLETVKDDDFENIRSMLNEVEGKLGKMTPGKEHARQVEASAAKEVTPARSRRGVSFAPSTDSDEEGDESLPNLRNPEQPTPASSVPNRMGGSAPGHDGSPSVAATPQRLRPQYPQHQQQAAQAGAQDTPYTPQYGNHQQQPQHQQHYHHRQGAVSDPPPQPYVAGETEFQLTKHDLETMDYCQRAHSFAVAPFFYPGFESGDVREVYFNRGVAFKEQIVDLYAQKTHYLALKLEEMRLNTNRQEATVGTPGSYSLYQDNYRGASPMYDGYTTPGRAPASGASWTPAPALGESSGPLQAYYATPPASRTQVVRKSVPLSGRRGRGR